MAVCEDWKNKQAGFSTSAAGNNIAEAMPALITSTAMSSPEGSSGGDLPPHDRQAASMIQDPSQEPHVSPHVPDPETNQPETVEPHMTYLVGHGQSEPIQIPESTALTGDGTEVSELPSSIIQEIEETLRKSPFHDYTKQLYD